MNGNVKQGDCLSSIRPKNQVDSIAVWAQRAGKATGIVTTTRVTHASPAGVYSHTSNRDYESDTDITTYATDPTGCRDIAKQLIFDSPGRDFNVIFGGGRKKFLPGDKLDDEGKPGNRSDGLDLINVWRKKHRNGKYITTKKELKNLELKGADQVLGLFASSHMEYNLDNVDHRQPSLKEMTQSAIRLLKNDKEGYFLFVEGGRIDHGHHETRPAKALDETVQFSEAVQAAVDMTNREDTLIIVTSDHAHTMSISGYPERGNPILGVGSAVGTGNILNKITIFLLLYSWGN